MVPEKLTPPKLPHPKASAKQAPPYPLLQGELIDPAKLPPPNPLLLFLYVKEGVRGVREAKLL